MNALAAQPSVEPVRLEHLDREAWGDALACFCDRSYQQEFAYAETLAARQAALHEEVAVWDGDELIGLASIRIRRIPLLGVGVAYIPSGPMVNRGADGDIERLGLCLSALRAEYVSRRGLQLRVLLPIGSPDWNMGAAQVMAGLGLRRIPHGRGYETMIVNLERPLDDIRKGLAQKWRNCLNRAERQGLSVRWLADVQDFDRFAQAHSAFVAHKGFRVDLDASFFADVRRSGAKELSLAIAWAEWDDTPVAAHLGSYAGDTAVYLLGYTTERGMRSQAAYLLQWAVLQRAQALGMKWYDLGGIDPIGNPGVYHFKEGLGGVAVQAAGPMEYTSGWMSRRLLKLAEHGRRVWRRRR